jgi:hypothetical protein
MVRPSPHGLTVGARVRGASRAARDEAAKAFFVELGMDLEGQATVEGSSVGRLVDWLRFGLPTPRIDSPSHPYLEAAKATLSAEEVAEADMVGRQLSAAEALALGGR